jgi:alpha-tubulin suppressor-like RCC1 family protein
VKVVARAAGAVKVIASLPKLGGSASWADTLEISAGTAQVRTITIEPTSVTLGAGQSSTLTATLKDDFNNTLTGRIVTWTSSDNAIATVDAKGVVTGVKPGTTTVLAQSGAQIATATINVTSAFSLRDQTLAHGGDSWNGEFTCAIAQDRSAYCWGRNNQGQLGDGTTLDRSTPVKVVGDIRFETLTATTSTVCGIDVNQDAYCWGGSSLGDGTQNSRSIPGLVSGGMRWRALSGGNDFVCGIALTNRAYCWGQNYYGTLGNGKVGRNSSNQGDGYSSVPVPVSFSQDVRAIVAHNVGACVLTGDGEAYCWGWSGNGELGNGSQGDIISATPVKVLGGHKFDAITAGGQAICGQVSSGTTYCWGSSWNGKLTVDGSFSIPVPVLWGGVDIRSVSIGRGSHSCGVSADGKAYCWGGNDWGKLGQTSPAQTQSPLELALGERIVSVLAGEDHTCAVLQSGTVKCWGSNIFGELGNGTTSGKTRPTLIVGGQSFTSVAASYNSSCAIDSNAKAWCWGGPAWSLNVSQGNVVLTPTNISSALSFVELVDFDYTKCGRQANGQVWCWGAGWDGQRGDGTNGGNLSISRVAISEVVTQLSAFQSHACAVTVANSVYCWGRNDGGQLGDNTTTNRITPVKVPGSFIHVAAGGRHSCALTADGTAFCWGGGANGQLGDGTGNDSRVPIAVATNVKFSRLALGGWYSCGIALQPAGKVYCWGNNNYGKLGTGSNSGQFQAPVAMNSNLSFDRLVAGNENVCARSTAGEWYCSGSAEWSLFGDAVPAGTREVSSPTRIGGDPGLDELAVGNDHACGVDVATKQAYCWGRNRFGKLTGAVLAPTGVSGGMVFRGSR